MNTKSLVKHIALVATLCVAASAQAQLLGGGARGALGGAVGGMIGGSAGGNIGAMGSMNGRSIVNEVRPATRAIDTGSLRRPADVSGNGNAGGQASADSSSGAGSASGSLGLGLSGNARNVVQGAGRYTVDGARRAGDAVNSVEMDKSVSVEASGSGSVRN